MQETYRLMTGHFCTSTHFAPRLAKFVPPDFTRLHKPLYFNFLQNCEFLCYFLPESISALQYAQLLQYDKPIHLNRLVR